VLRTGREETDNKLPWVIFPSITTGCSCGAEIKVDSDISSTKL